MYTNDEASKMLAALTPLIEGVTRAYWKKNKIVRSLGAVEDAVQTATLEVWRRLTNGKPLPDPATKYLKALIRHRLVRAAHKATLVQVSERTMKQAKRSPGAADSRRIFDSAWPEALPDLGRKVVDPASEESGGVDSEETEAKAARARILYEAMAALKPEHREAIELGYGLGCSLGGGPAVALGMTAREVGAALGLSRTGFVKRLARARRALKRELKARGMEEWL